MEKHIAYFELVDALGTDFCAICYLVEKGIDKYFQHLLYENINDIGFRKTFLKNNGFCNYHSYKFMDYHDGLAIALTHKEILLTELEKIRNDKLKFQKTKRSRCQICSLSTETENTYLTVMYEYLEDNQMKNKFINSAGLCIPHLEMFMTKYRKTPIWFREFHINRYAEVINLLNKYLDSQNYSLGEARPVLDKKEELIWKKLIRLIYGYKGRQNCLIES
jgi:hypothetical protein